MLRPTDPAAPPVPLDHIGATLAEASRTWRTEYERRMDTLGQHAAREAAAQALAFIPPEGATQASLARALGTSKQAAQQCVERLCHLDLVIRRPDPTDHRAVRVMLTERGRVFVDQSNEVKQAIETLYRGAIGNSAFAMLKAMLGRLPHIGE